MFTFFSSPRKTLVLLLGTATVIAAAAVLERQHQDPALYWNLSPSSPRGVYLTAPLARAYLAVGGTLATDGPFVYLPHSQAPGGYMLKRVHTCAGTPPEAAWIYYHCASKEAPLPARIQPCPAGDVFLLSDHSRGYDSCYAGPYRQDYIAANGVLLTRVQH